MRRFAPAFFAVGIGIIFIAPVIAHATGIPYFGPIVPPDGSVGGGSVCAGSWGGILQTLNNIIAVIITIAILFAAPLFIAYAGFLYLTSGGSPGGRSKANAVLTDAIVGIVIVLAAYLIVDATLTALTYQGVAGWTSQVFSNAGGSCLSVATSLNQAAFPTGPNAASGLSSSGTVSTGSTAQCASGNSNCSVTALQSAGFTTAQANAMSCIAVTENSGNSSGCNSVNACGTFQIVVTVNQLSGPDCAQYNNGNPTLNCPALCHGNNGVAVTTTACQPCVQAANNPACNAESAAALYGSSGFGPWTTSSDNTKSGACVQQYDPTGT